MYFQTLICIFMIRFSACVIDERTKCSMQMRSSKIPAEMMKLIQQMPFEYTCPRNDDPKTFTECCNDAECCEPSLLSLATSNEDLVLMITGILVISICLILTILSVICCFWSKCPLYNTCRPSYTTSNVIAYSLGKEDPTLLMPADGYKRGQYNPFSVKIKRVQEV